MGALTRDPKPSLATRAARAALWLGAGRAGAGLLHYLAYLLLAFILPADDFGLLGLGLMVVIFVEAVGGLGLTAALIQSDHLEEEALNTAFWASLGVSSIMAAAAMLSADSIAIFFGDVRAASIIRWLSALFPVYALTSVPLALLERELRFKMISIQTVVAEIGYAAAGLTMALLGYGVWSLVGAVLTQRIGGIAVLWFAVDWRPKLRFDRRQLPNLLSFGMPVLAGLTLQRAAGNLDRFVVARWLGTEALGFYTLAYQLAVVPVQRLTSLALRILFPSFAEVKHDAARLANGVLLGLQQVFALLAPFCLALAVLAPAFVEALYQQKWLPSAGAMQILAVGALFTGLDFSPALFYAVGKPGLRVWLVGVQAVTFVLLAAALGADSGIEAIAACVASSLALTAAIALFLISQLINRGLAALASRIWPAARGALLALIPVVILAPWSHQWSPGRRLVLVGVPMLVVYFLALIPVYRLFLQRVAPGLARRYRPSGNDEG